MTGYRDNLRICMAASAGGHISQLLKIVENWDVYDRFYITTTEVIRDKLRKRGRVYVVGECNRQHPIRLMKVLARCIMVVFKERPDIIISTGAASGCIVCFLGKIIGAKIIWIDSITNIERISLSGRLVRYISDLFLVQWPGLAQRQKGIEYVGELI